MGYTPPIKLTPLSANSNPLIIATATATLPPRHSDSVERHGSTTTSPRRQSLFREAVHEIAVAAAESRSPGGRLVGNSRQDDSLCSTSCERLKRLARQVPPPRRIEYASPCTRWLETHARIDTAQLNSARAQRARLGIAAVSRNSTGTASGTEQRTRPVHALTHAWSAGLAFTFECSRVEIGLCGARSRDRPRDLPLTASAAPSVTGAADPGRHDSHPDLLHRRDPPP